MIDELADDKNIMEAEKLGVGSTSVDVDGAFAQMCSRMRPLRRAGSPAYSPLAGPFRFAKSAVNARPEAASVEISL